MIRKTLLLILLIMLGMPVLAHAQAWSSILSPVSGPGACTSNGTAAPGKCAIDWSTAGVPGGIPSRTTICSTLTSSASVAQINSALNSCPSGQVVYLSAGTYAVNSNISIPGNVTLRGAGANKTILNSTVTSGPVVQMGTGTPNFANAVSITGGNAAGSTSITVSNASGITTGSYLAITQQNDGTIVSVNGAEGTCNWCDGFTSTGLYAQGQIVEVESVSGTTIGINPALYVSYTRAPLAVPFAMQKYAGAESLQVYANNTHTALDYSNFVMSSCAYCWISGVEGNYTDGDHVEVAWGYHDQIQNNYFSNAYLHGAGSYDSTLDLNSKSTGVLVQNNILERLHASIMLEWGVAGNVVAYNYMFGNYDAGNNYFTEPGLSMHGAHPQFNLYEGNIDIFMSLDNIWGSSANNTLFRNFVVGASKYCMPRTGRAAVSCSPTGAAGAAGTNGWWTSEQIVNVAIAAQSTNYNSVGNVYGSSEMTTIREYSSLTGPLLIPSRMVDAVCGISPCGSNSYDAYDNYGYNYIIGYSEGSTGGGSSDSANPMKTLFVHGDYSSVANTVSWASGVTQSIPASFYLNSKPAWFGGAAWPAIGPDVSQGSRSDSFGYANKIPAEVCYEQVMAGTDGTGSPLNFNADACYTGGSVLPPSNVLATPH